MREQFERVQVSDFLAEPYRVRTDLVNNEGKESPRRGRERKRGTGRCKGPAARRAERTSERVAGWRDEDSDTRSGGRRVPSCVGGEKSRRRELGRRGDEEKRTRGVHLRRNQQDSLTG